MRLLDRLRARRLGPMTRDLCEACGKRLRLKERVEVFSASASDEFGPMGGGGVSATYCKKDAPRSAA